MSREIKFRAWDNNKKIMYYDENSSFIFSSNKIECNFDNGWLTKNTGIFMQFTGLKDRNGKEIYEGDILSNKDTYGYMVVNWSPTSAGFCLDKKGWIFSHYFKEAVDAEECEVIGNIHENPELLKG